MDFLDGGQTGTSKWLKALCDKGLTSIAPLSSGLPLLTEENARSNAKSVVFDGKKAAFRASGRQKEKALKAP
ncbi:hypothetical protein [Paraburkholderia sp. J41]|uniref:hypothetical protein n=1 Tax=Paraburkholderia sp. J41 TaxID=2805433 RepID=UPI002AC3269F|nr:hypothetical protein [Paraburkholderia sp. J41]